ncbi:MAG: IS1595 family transposase [Bacteroidetes bacterium]|nr:MAG: IS1595 family transposase [Bacteroidota bacterium]
MTRFEFFEKYGTEEQCRAYLRDLRFQQGIICKKCGGTKHYWMKNKGLFQCSNVECRFRTTLKSGTIMDSSNLPVRDWFYAMYLMTTYKKGLSSKELQRQLGYKRNEPAWLMMHKIRNLMEVRESKYTLNGELEVDEIFVRTSCHLPEGEEVKRGKGSQRQTPAVIAVESTQVEGKEGKPEKPEKKLGYAKFGIIQSHDSDEAHRVVKKMLGLVKLVTTDKGTEFKRMNEVAEKHVQVKSNKENNDKHLPWVGIVTANLKRFLLGTYHSVSPKYLNRYLAEFSYRLNRRYFGLGIFQRLLNISVLSA